MIYMRSYELTDAIFYKDQILYCSTFVHDGTVVLKLVEAAAGF